MNPEIDPFKTDHITLEDVMRKYPPQPMLNPHPPLFEGKVLAVGRAIFDTVPRRAVDSLLKFGIDMARKFPAGNLWMLPTFHRLPYPYAVYWPLGCAFKSEKEYGRRFDYYLWMDDDVLFDINDVIKMSVAMETHDLKFIAACPYDRMRPYSPSIVEKIDGVAYKWVKAPDSGSYPVAMTGYNLCLFRRDVFEEVPEPWWGVCAPSKGFSGVAPDWWWSIQMEQVGLQPWVCCDTNVSHISEEGLSNKGRSVEFFNTHDVASLGLMEDTRLITSPNTGAVMTLPPKFPDGRGEFKQKSNLGVTK